MSRLSMLLLALASVALGSCVADEAGNSARGCDSDVDCEAGQMCYRGFCVLREPDAGFDAGPIIRDAGRRDAAAGEDAGGSGDAGDAPDAGGEDADIPACTEGTVEACYTGDPGTRGVGSCSDGERTCTSGAWSVCEGETTPVPEECNGADDDCDGSTDEDFSLDTDPLHCGDCSTVCPSGSMCCEGGCVDTEMDKNNCGGCNVRCRPPQRQCCAGSCEVSC